MKKYVLLFLIFAGRSFSAEYVDMPFNLIDENGRSIDSYCFLPLYTKKSGFGFGVENYGRKSDGKYYLKWPEMIKPGDRYDDKIHVKFPFGLPPFFYFGESIQHSVFVFLKEGYAPFLWQEYVDMTKVVDVVLPYGDSSYVFDQLVSNNPDEAVLRDVYKIHPRWKVINEYTREDKELIARCYRKASGPVGR